MGRCSRRESGPFLSYLSSRRPVKFALLFLFAATVLLAREVVAEEAKDAAQPPIVPSGKILGVGIGMTLKEAREKLDAVRDPDAPRDEKEKFGSRAYWKLRETEFDWIMVWANRDRKIVRIRAMLRPEKQKPFDEIGNVADATSGPNGAVWNISTANGPIRISAFGQNGAAARISILAFDPSLPAPPEAEDAE